jgi:hypothetical protein
LIDEDEFLKRFFRLSGGVGGGKRFLACGGGFAWKVRGRLLPHIDTPEKTAVGKQKSKKNVPLPLTGCRNMMYHLSLCS